MCSVCFLLLVACFVALLVVFLSLAFVFCRCFVAVPCSNESWCNFVVVSIRSKKEQEQIQLVVVPCSNELARPRSDEQHPLEDKELPAEAEAGEPFEEPSRALDAGDAMPETVTSAEAGGTQSSSADAAQDTQVETAQPTIPAPSTGLPDGVEPVPEGVELRVGDVVYRRGERATVVHVDRTLWPVGYTVKMTLSGREVSTEAEFLTWIPPEATAASSSTASATKTATSTKREDGQRRGGAKAAKAAKREAATENVGEKQGAKATSVAKAAKLSGKKESKAPSTPDKVSDWFICNLRVLGKSFREVFWRFP